MFVKRFGKGLRLTQCSRSLACRVSGSEVSGDGEICVHCRLPVGVGVTSSEQGGGGGATGGRTGEAVEDE